MYINVRISQRTLSILRCKANVYSPVAMINHDRNNTSFDNSQASIVNYNAAYSSNPPAERIKENIIKF